MLATASALGVSAYAVEAYQFMTRRVTDKRRQVLVLNEDIDMDIPIQKER